MAGAVELSTSAHGNRKLRDRELRCQHGRPAHELRPKAAKAQPAPLWTPTRAQQRAQNPRRGCPVLLTDECLEVAGGFLSDFRRLVRAHFLRPSPAPSRARCRGRHVRVSAARTARKRSSNLCGLGVSEQRAGRAELRFNCAGRRQPVEDVNCALRASSSNVRTRFPSNASPKLGGSTFAKC
jgi:hypothetical protein